MKTFFILSLSLFSLQINAALDMNKIVLISKIKSVSQAVVTLNSKGKDLKVSELFFPENLPLLTGQEIRLEIAYKDFLILYQGNTTAMGGIAGGGGGK